MRCKGLLRFCLFSDIFESYIPYITVLCHFLLKVPHWQQNTELPGQQTTRHVVNGQGKSYFSMNEPDPVTVEVSVVRANAELVSCCSESA